MIFKKALLCVATAGIFAATGMVMVVAVAFALYASVEPMIGPAGAAASVAVAAVLVLVLARLSLGGLRFKREPSMAERVAEMIRDKPLSALAAAAVAGFFAMRNPQVLAELLKILLDPKRNGRA